MTIMNNITVKHDYHELLLNMINNQIDLKKCIVYYYCHKL